jgi:hypothetical protein
VFATTVTGGSTKTTGTSVTETCATITGCNLKDIDATTTANVCTIQKRAVRETNVPEPDEEAASKREQAASKTAKIKSRAIIPHHDFLRCQQDSPYAIIWPLNPELDNEQDEIRGMLVGRFQQTSHGYQEARADDMHFTAFYVVESVDDDAMAFFNSDLVPQIYLAYHPTNPVLPPHVPPNPVTQPLPIIPRNAKEKGAVTEPTEPRSANDETVATQFNEQRSFNNGTMQSLSKRVIDNYANDAWHVSMVSWGPDVNFDEEHLPGHQPANNQYYSSWDDSYGQGQTIYIMEDGMDTSNPVSLLLLFA